MKTFYIDIKAIKLFKKYAMFQRKMEELKSKQPKN